MKNFQEDNHNNDPFCPSKLHIKQLDGICGIVAISFLSVDDAATQHRALHKNRTLWYVALVPHKHTFIIDCLWPITQANSLPSLMK